LKKTQIELESTEKIVELLSKEIKLKAEDNVCCSLCANASSSEVRRPSGLHQLNDVSNKDNHIPKDRSDQIKELKSDIAELNHLLKHARRVGKRGYLN
jgi:hypothetical protein